MDAAERLIVERGPHGFTLVEAARRAEVSPAAPYRHFRNRRALLGAVAVRGFEAFAAGLEAAWDDGTPDPLSALKRMGAAYMAFAAAHGGAYKAMFEAGLTGADHAEFEAAGGRAFEILTRAATALGGQLPDGRAAPADLVGAHLWSLSHGIATLFAGHKGRGGLDMGVNELLELGVGIYLHGLGRPVLMETRELDRS